MAFTFANVLITDNFSTWLTRTNQMAGAFANVVATGSNTATGNAAITGTFTANGFVTNTLSSSGTLYINSNTEVGALQSFDVLGNARFRGSIRIDDITLVNTSSSSNSTHYFLAANSSNGRLYFASLPSTISGVTTFSSNVTFSANATFNANVEISQHLNVSSFSVTGTTTLNAISANGSLGTAGQVLTSNGSDTYWSTVVSGGGGAGTVTSVGLSLPATFTVTNSPVTSSGTLTASWASQLQNRVFAAPSSGVSGIPSFRALVEGDIPTLAQSKITNLTSDLAGKAPLTGTGATGTWSISVTGNAGTVTNGVYTVGDQTIAGNKTFTGTVLGVEESLTVALSDEATALTAGTAKITFRAPFAMTLTKAPRASLSTAASVGTVTVDINVNNNTILSPKLTIDAGQKTSTTAGSQAVLSTSSIADDAEITMDLDVVGTGSKGLKVTLYYKRAS